MLHETVVLAGLQVLQPSSDKELEKIAGQIRNLYYAASLPWCEGNLGRAIPLLIFQDFYEKFLELRNAFEDLVPKGEGNRFNVTLIVVPFPENDVEHLSPWILQASHHISTELEKRFDNRLRMLVKALEEGERFYSSLLSELEKVIEIGVYLEGGEERTRFGDGKTKVITPQLFARLRAARSNILIHSAEEIRQSTSLRKEIINYCGDLL